jgi:2-(1,2-epoxy-1,2-dihydrophenyl)acetyl-CoA isomerase
VTSSATIEVARVGAAGNVAQVVLSRPDHANAMTVGMAHELNLAVERALADDEVHAILLTGHGKSFCPGADAKETLDMAQRIERREYPEEPFGGVLAAVQKATRTIFNAVKPTVAVVNGPAAAGGLDLALACDFRVACRSSKFAQSYVKLALPPLNGGAWLLSRLIGDAAALRMLLTGDTIDAQRALEIGLVHELVEGDEALDHGIALAAQLGAGTREIVRFIKEEVRRGAFGTLEDAQARAFVAGVTATRAPDFRGAVERMLSAYRRKEAGNA